MSQAGRFTPEITPGTYIEQINGDIGSVSGAIINLWATPTSGSSVSFSGVGSTMSFNVTDSLSNTLIGKGAGNLTLTGQFNTALGFNAASSLTGAVRTVAVGYLAGSGITSGGGNIAIGYDSLQVLSTGDYNTAIGTFAAQGLGSGSEHNVAIGTLALDTDGAVSSYNVAIGTSALIADTNTACVAIGYYAAGSDGGTLVGLTAVGYECQLSASIGFNTAFGYRALRNNISGSNNIALGHDVAPTIISGSSNIYIGNIDSASSAESDTTRIGNDGHTSACYILGIDTVDIGPTANMVVCSGSDQLGTAVLVAGTGITITTGSNIITISSDNAAVSNYVTVTNATSPYTVLADDNYISADVTAGTVTIRLPNSPTVGRLFTIKDKVGLSATNNITVTTVGGTVTIDGATSFFMNTAYEAISVIFNGLTYEVW